MHSSLKGNIIKLVLVTLLWLCISGMTPHGTYLKECLTKLSQDIGANHDVVLSVGVSYPPAQHLHPICWFHTLVLCQDNAWHHSHNYVGVPQAGR